MKKKKNLNAVGSVRPALLLFNIILFRNSLSLVAAVAKHTICMSFWCIEGKVFGHSILLIKGVGPPFQSSIDSVLIYDTSRAGTLSTKIYNTE